MEKEQYVVIAPMGGFGNHVTWLAWMHVDEAQSTKWPINGVEQKIKFIEKSVYPLKRTWHNWLWYEMRFRNIFSDAVFTNFIRFDHIMQYDDYNDHTNKYLFLRSDVDLCTKHYMKLGPCFCNMGILKWQKLIHVHNSTLDKLPNQSNHLILNGPILWNSVLDKDFYDKMVKFFEFDNMYEHAKIVHKMWYDGQINAEQEFLQEAKRLYE